MNEPSIFMEALDKATPSERAAYLDAACAGDSSLRQRIEALLRCHESAGNFLEKLGPERVAEELPTQSESDNAGGGSLPPGGPSADDDGLGFLEPSEKPGLGRLGRLGHYEVLEVIGRGGMGIVLRAFDKKLHRVVAVKVLAPQLAVCATSRKRFIREAQAAAAVRNDHVVNIYAVEEIGPHGFPYLVMEYISGLSLQQRLDRSGPLKPEEILRIGMQIAVGLAAAHAQGLIHRDIKPANILLENGVERVKITDFGLARTVNDVGLSQSGVVPGTPQYMAPEQAAAELVDHRADLFSLGCVLYAMCAGKPPFCGGSTMAVLRRVCEDSPPPIADINPDIPARLIATIDKLLAKEPANRYQSATEVAELLKQHLAQLQFDVRDSDAGDGRDEVAGTPKGRRRRWTMIAAAVVCLIGSLGLAEAAGVTHLASTVVRILTPDGTLIVEVDDPNVKVSVEGDGGLVITGAGPQEVRLRPGHYRVLASKDGQPIKNDVITISRGDKQVVKVSLESGQRGAVPRFAFNPPPPGPFDKLNPAEIPAEERFAWQPKELVAVLGEHRQRHWARVQSVAWSGDGTVIASGGYDHMIRIWDPATMRERAVLRGHTWPVSSVALSADGRRLLSAGMDSTVRWWDVENGKELKCFSVSEQVDCVVLIPNGRHFLFGGHGNAVRLWDLETGTELGRFEGHTQTIAGLSLSADGRSVLSAGHDNALRLWEIGAAGIHGPRIGAKQARTLTGHNARVRAAALSADGRFALSGNFNNSSSHAADYELRLWELATSQEVRRLKGHASPIEGIAFASDGRHAISCSMDGTLAWWDVDTGRELGRFKGHIGSATCVALAPDGSRAVSGGGDGTVRLWDVIAKTELHPIAGPMGGAYQASFSANGGQLLTAGWDRCIRLWDIAEGARRPTSRCFRGHTDPVFSAAISPDGNHAISASAVLDPFEPQPSIGDRTNGAWLLWDIAGGDSVPARRLPGPRIEDVDCVAISPNGKHALTGCAGQVCLWDIVAGQKRRTFPMPSQSNVASVAFSPDGRHAISGDWGGDLMMWDIDSGRELFTFRREGTGGIQCVAFSPDGRVIAVGSNIAEGSAGIVRIVALDSGPPHDRFFLKGHADRILSVAFSPDGKRVASAGEDGRILLWDIATGDKIREWQLPGIVRGVTFAPDGRHLASANGNGTVYILRLSKP